MQPETPGLQRLLLRLANPSPILNILNLTKVWFCQCVQSSDSSFSAYMPVLSSWPQSGFQKQAVAAKAPRAHLLLPPYKDSEKSSDWEELVLPRHWFSKRLPGHWPSQALELQKISIHYNKSQNTTPLSSSSPTASKSWFSNTIVGSDWIYDWFKKKKKGQDEPGTSCGDREKGSYPGIISHIKESNLKKHGLAEEEKQTVKMLAVPRGSVHTFNLSIQRQGQRQKHWFLWVQDKTSLHSEFQDIHGYIDPVSKQTKMCW